MKRDFLIQHFELLVVQGLLFLVTRLRLFAACIQCCKALRGMHSMLHAGLAIDGSVQRQVNYYSAFPLPISASEYLGSWLIAAIKKG